MRVAVIGGSKFKDEKRVIKTLDYYRKDITEIVSGGAKGADTFGENWANTNKVKKNIFPAKWSDLTHPNAVIKEKNGRKYDAMAGMRRNTDIIENCDMVIVFWDGISPGSKDSINKARKLKIPTLLIYVDYLDYTKK